MADDSTFDRGHLQQAARDHLWMHFTRHSAYDNADIPVIVRGDGPYIWDADGKRYLDALAGLFVSQLGHGRLEVRLDKLLGQGLVGQLSQGRGVLARRM